MGLLRRVFGGVVLQSKEAMRSVEKSVQEVVEVLQPGALGSSAARWDHDRRAKAEQAVEQALANWHALEQQPDHPPLKQEQQPSSSQQS